MKHAARLRCHLYADDAVDRNDHRRRCFQLPKREGRNLVVACPLSFHPLDDVIIGRIAAASHIAAIGHFLAVDLVFVVPPPTGGTNRLNRHIRRRHSFLIIQVLNRRIRDTHQNQDRDQRPSDFYCRIVRETARNGIALFAKAPAGIAQQNRDKQRDQKGNPVQANRKADQALHHFRRWFLISVGSRLGHADVLRPGNACCCRESHCRAKSD